jgi:hypothetical protein
MKTEKENGENEPCQSTNNPREWNGRTIEIDDAGTGDLVGDAFIGFRDTKNGKTIFRSVPVGLYAFGNTNEDPPRKHIVKIVNDGLKALNHRKEDRILLCRGSCFDLVREYFDENGIYYEPAIIEGELQDAVEGRYIQHLRKLGITSKKLTKEAGAQRYFILFNWACQDFPYRERFVKRGFPSWEKKWRKIAMRRSQKHSKNMEDNRKIMILQRADEIYKSMLENPISVRKSTSKNR